MLSFILECGNSTAGNCTRLALRIRVNMSEIVSVINFYQLALVTPGISPFNAPSRKVKREQANFLMYPWRRPLIEQRFTTRVGLALRGSFDSAA